MTAMNAIAIRHATDADTCVLADLAILDSRPQLTGPALIAEVDGIVRAALDLRHGSVAADPFFPTAELVDLLRVRARRLGSEEPARPLRERALARLRRPRRALSVRA